MKDELVQDMVERLVRIETKLDNYELLREKTEDAKEKADHAFSIAKNNVEDIKENKRKSKMDLADNCWHRSVSSCLFIYKIFRRCVRMILPDKYYKIIKWGVLTVLPAGSVLVATLGKAYGWQQTDTAVLTINAVSAFLGVVTGVSAYNLKDKEK